MEKTDKTAKEFPRRQRIGTNIRNAKTELNTQFRFKCDLAKISHACRLIHLFCEFEERYYNLASV